MGPGAGAALKTFFVGACLLQFPNVFDVWATEQRQWGQLHDGEKTLDDAVGGADPQWSDPTGDAAVRACAARECLDGIPDARTRRAAWMVFAEASHAEAGAAVGLSAGGVEGRLYDLKDCLASHYDAGSPALRIVVRCQVASRAAGQDDMRTGRALWELLLAAIVVERSSLGTARSRQLRNLAAHGDVTAARALWRSLADRERETSQDACKESGPGEG